MENDVSQYVNSHTPATRVFQVFPVVEVRADLVATSNPQATEKLRSIDAIWQGRCTR